MTGISQAILSVRKTGENGGALREFRDYTCYCAEEPTGRAPALSSELIVEPDKVLFVQMQDASLAACEAEYLEGLHLGMTSDMS